MLRRKNVNDPTAIRELSTSAYLRHFFITGLEEFLNQLPAIERISPLQSKAQIGKNVNDPTAIRELSTSAYLRHFFITGLEEFLNQLPAIERISPLQSKA